VLTPSPDRVHQGPLEEIHFIVLMVFVYLDTYAMNPSAPRTVGDGEIVTSWDGGIEYEVFRMHARRQMT
jgi:hypothetical protein